MTNYKARREPRAHLELNVTLQTIDGEARFKTRNASFEGIFIVCSQPYPLRRLIRLRTNLGDEEIDLLGLVAHTVNPSDAAERGTTAGMGIQLYTVGQEARVRWRDFIRKRYEEDPKTRAAAKSLALPHVRVRIPSIELLEKFYSTDLPTGGIFLRTSELQPEGTEVWCDVVHPTSGHIFALHATVGRVVETPLRERGMQLNLTPLEDNTALQMFVYGDPESQSPE